jgi:beta-lactamase class A
MHFWVSAFTALMAAQAPLSQQIAQLAVPAKGKISVSCSLPGSALNCDLNAAAKPPMQSVFKLPLAMMALHLVEQKTLDLDAPLRFRPEDRIVPRAYSPLQDKYPEAGVDLPLREMLRLCVSLSDNVATDIVLRLIGGPLVLDRYVASLGLSGFHVEDGETSLHQDERRQYRNWFQPLAAVQLLRILADRPPLTSEHAALLRTWMADPTLPSRFLPKLPPGAHVMHKSGSSGFEAGLAAATNDIGLIQLPDGRLLALAVFITDSPADDATRDAVFASIGRAVYDAAVQTH